MSRRPLSSTAACSVGPSQAPCRGAPARYVIATPRRPGRRRLGSTRSRQGGPDVEHLRGGGRHRCPAAWVSGRRGRSATRRRRGGGRPHRRVLTDPRGAVPSVAGRRRLGAQVVNPPGAWNFSDLHTADPGRRGRSNRGLRLDVVDDLGSRRAPRPGLRRPPGRHRRPRHPCTTGDRPAGFADVIGGRNRTTAGDAALARDVHRLRSGRSRASRKRSAPPVLAPVEDRVDRDRRRPGSAGRAVHREPVHPARLAPRWGRSGCNGFGTYDASATRPPPSRCTGIGSMISKSWIPSGSRLRNPNSTQEPSRRCTNGAANSPARR